MWRVQGKHMPQLTQLRVAQALRAAREPLLPWTEGGEEARELLLILEAVVGRHPLAGAETRSAREPPPIRWQPQELADILYTNYTFTF